MIVLKEPIDLWEDSSSDLDEFFVDDDVLMDSSFSSTSHGD